MQAGHLIAQLGFDICKESRIGRVHGATEHAVLPHQDALLVTELVEVLLFVQAASPDAQHVHVCIDGILQQLIVAFTREPAHEGVQGNPVGTFCKDVPAVHRENHALSAFCIFLCLDLQGSEADALGCFLSADGKLQRIQYSLALAVGPPWVYLVADKTEGDSIQTDVGLDGSLL